MDGRHFDLVIDTQITLRRTLSVRRIRHSRFISACAGYWLSDKRPTAAQKPGRHLLKNLTLLLDLAAPERMRFAHKGPIDVVANTRPRRRVAAGRLHLYRHRPRRRRHGEGLARSKLPRRG